MRDPECVEFLRWCLPQLGLRWAGYRKVRRTPCKRIARRMRALGLDELEDYRARLGADPAEWPRLEAMCRIPISRFCRDRALFEALSARVFPELANAAAARGADRVRCWSAGCASGEEAYSLAMAWRAGGPHAVPDLEVIGTDADPVLLERAEAAIYAAGSLRDVPPAWKAWAFEESGGLFRVAPEVRAPIRFALQDVRDAAPAGKFDLVACRNLAFTYFAPDSQRAVLARLRASLRDGGMLLIGGHERLPDPAAGFAACGPLPILRAREPGA